MKKAATVITATLVAVFFSGLVNAGRVNVPQKSGSASTVASAIASRAGDIISSGVVEGTFIPGYQQDRQIPVKVINSNDFSARRTFEAATGLLKRGGPVAGAVAASAAIGWAVDVVGGFIDSNGQPAKKGGSAAPASCAPGQICWTPRSFNGGYFPTAEAACKAFPPDSGAYLSTDVGGSGKYADCQRTLNGKDRYDTYMQVVQEGSTCPEGYTYNSSIGSCAGSAQPSPFEQSDWDKLQSALNNASGSNTAGDPNFIKDLIHASCEGSNAPQRCYESLMANGPGAASQSLSGPSTVTAPGTSSITVSKDKDGNATSTTTNSTTTFNITYGNNYYNYSSTTTKNKTNPDGSTETTTEEEPEEDATKYPAQPDALTPVIKEYDKITDALKSQETVDGADRSAWFSFGGGCSELDFDSPIGHVRTNWCPTIEGYVKPCLGFLFSLGTFIYIFALWKETTMEVRPI